MSIEKTAQRDEKEHSRNLNSNQPEETATHAAHGDASIDWQGLTPAADQAETVNASTSPHALKSKHSPKPDARDEAKVEELAAPDWRSEQPLPSASNAVDPRGENSPPELFEPEQTHKERQRSKGA